MGSGQDRAEQCDPSQASGAHPELLTADEAAAYLRISAKTLANWRSSSKGPAWRKHGGRVVYPWAGVVEWSTENTGLCQQGKPRVTVTTRVYKRDPTRTQVDIMISHPATGEVVRRRLVAPAGHDPVAAKAWGERKVKEILKDLFLAQAKPAVEHVETREHQIERPTKQVPTLGELWDQYAANIPTKKESQRRTKRRHWTALRAIAEHVRCDSWTYRENQKLTERFLKQSAGYHNGCVILLRILFRMAVAAKYLAEVPQLPRRQLESTVLDLAHGPDDIASLLAAARKVGAEWGENLELLILLGLDGGLRPGEVAGLRWKDVDWRENQIIVRNQRPLAGASDCAVKTGEAGRIDLPRRLRLALEVHRESSSSPYVITNGEGEPLYTSRISTRVERVHKAAGLDPKGAHFLRHCAASRIFAASGGSVSAAQAHLRHKLASTTERYLHAVRGTSAGKEAAALLDRLEETGNGLATDWQRSDGV